MGGEVVIPTVRLATGEDRLLEGSAAGGSGPSYWIKGREPDLGWIAAFEAGSPVGQVPFLHKHSCGRKVGSGSSNA